jgi:tetratricopeptide (TPR) repeat protein
VRGESRQAAEIYKRLLENAPLDIEARVKMIELLVQQDRVDEALQQFVELAEMYRQMADLESARKSLGNGLKLAKRVPGGERWQLKILHQMGDIDVSRLDPRRALTVYGEICQLAPEDEVARYNVIDLNLRLDQEDQAARELDSYLEYLVKNTRSSEALTMLEELAQEHPGKQVLHACLAEAYRAAGRKADAIAQYDALGEIQLDAGQIKDAAHSIQAIIDLNPPDIEGYRELLRNLKAGQ